MDAIDQLTLLEMKVYLEVCKTNSFRSAARNMELKPSHVSKILNRIEKKLQASMFLRSNKGAKLTAEGSNLKPHIEKIVEAAQSLRENRHKPQAASRRSEVMGVGSLSFLNSELTSPCLDSLEKAFPEHRFRLIDLAPDQLINSALKGAFDIAIHVGKLEWTTAWQSKLLGHITWNIIARRNHPLKTSVSKKELLGRYFVVPTYWHPEGFTVGNDFCPLSWEERLKGHESSTASAALSIVKYTDHLAFIPSIIARSSLAHKEVKEIHVHDWDIHTKPVFLTVRADRVKNKMMQKISKILTKELEQLKL